MRLKEPKNKPSNEAFGLGANGLKNFIIKKCLLVFFNIFKLDLIFFSS